MRLYGYQQILLHPENELEAILEFVCKTANSLINCGIYYARQIYFKTKKFLGKYDLEAEYKTNKHFKALHSQAAQQVLRSVSESFESFKKLKQAFNRGKIVDKPKPPKYRKSGGFALVSYPKQALKLVDNQIRIPLGKQVKCWFGLDCFFVPMPSNLNFADIKELRILPRNRCFYVEFIYKTNIIEVDVDSNNVLGIDPGLSNWLTCVSNVGTSFIVDGRHVKSLNRWYNKQVSTLKENKSQGFWSNRLAAITEKRNRQMRDAINKAARLVINHCIENRIGTVVFGWNQGQRQEVKLGKSTQSFVQIPTAKLKKRVSQLCQQYGIKFVETEEANTSAASFLDNDTLPKRGEKPTNWRASGKRVKRGLYRTANNWYVNCDAQAAANIIRKVAVTLGLDLSGIGRGSLTAPQRIRLWSVKQKRSGVVSTHHVASV
ncbi:MAG: IS200/IS605 family transposase ISSoc6 [Chroococcidiopsis cubana SAG 39.79]|uniref:Transposase n=1 Tax=Chroococcidiopsis cubana SAG 39.79 TaxID=388085 RepID=A0AB37UK21_9CYAN|nr:RNA-guided endonuclease TnpB family protein [Chroococcidiopsis cubana]MDZ4873585.1 IS200/IS605 family transposase ISSoc6 [Chroococcidiopsis cubana SAG 39.79]RUT11763.1 transposase [Chroococcidiopsis cubana SAG 39.79]